MNGKFALFAPWTVYINFFRGRVNYFCTGVLIDYEWVLTEAHCFERLWADGSKKHGLTKPDVSIEVIAGSLNRTTSESNAQLQLVSEIHVNDQYRYSAPDVNSYDDVALLKLESKLIPSRTVIPICMHQLVNSGDSGGDRAWFQGWGALSVRSNRVSRRLHQAKVHLVPQKECEQLYNRDLAGSKVLVTGHHMCARGNRSEQEDSALRGKRMFGTDEQIGACSGDSGGPLSVTHKGRTTLIGLASWGGPCDGFPGKPIVFSRIASYFDWITNRTGLKPCEF
jgi:secreted trypsin-like serine protease